MPQKRSLEDMGPPNEQGDPSDPEVKEPAAKKAKEIAPAKYWTFTWHFEDGEDYNDAAIKSIMENPKVDGIIVGKEVCPTTGRKHFQGYLEFKTKNRPFCLKLPKVVHWEVAGGNGHHNQKYCTKEDKDAVIWGSCRKYIPYRLQLELKPWQNELFEILKTEPDDRSIYWIYEREGGVGKSIFCKWLLVEHPELDTIITGGKTADILHQVSEANKAGKLPKRIILDLPRSFNKEFICFHALESLKNMCFYSGKYEGGMVVGPCPHLVIFANDPPQMDKLSADRWRVYTIEQDQLIRYERKAA